MTARGQTTSAPPTLAYASPRAPGDQGETLRASMRAWRLYTAWGIVVLLLTGWFWPMGVTGLILTLVAVVITLVQMTRFAAHHCGTSYAIRHLVLSVCLMPMLLLGVFVVPRLVETDIDRWRAIEDRRDTAEES